MLERDVSVEARRHPQGPVRRCSGRRSDRLAAKNPQSVCHCTNLSNLEAQARAVAKPGHGNVAIAYQRCDDDIKD